METLLGGLWSRWRWLCNIVARRGYYAKERKGLDAEARRELMRSAIGERVQVVLVSSSRILVGHGGSSFEVDVECPDLVVLGEWLYVYGVEGEHFLCFKEQDLFMSDILN